MISCVDGSDGCFPSAYDIMENPVSFGYNVYYLSVFDHWLTDDESDSCNYLYFKDSLRSGDVVNYLKGEYGFINFLLDLCGRNVLTNVNFNIISTSSVEFINYVTKSLREMEFMDMYCMDNGLRIIGGFDRCNVILCKNSDMFQHIEVLAEKNNLFLLKK